MNEQELLKSANAKLASTDYAGAIADCDQVIKLNPQNTEAHHIRGDAKYSLKQYDDAITDFNQAIILNRQSAAAITDPEYAMTIWQECAEIYRRRGNAKASLKRYDDAIADYGEAMGMDPMSPFAAYDKTLAETLKESDASLKKVTTKYEKQFEELKKEYEEKILDRTPYNKSVERYGRLHDEIRKKAHKRILIVAVVSIVFILYAIGIYPWPFSYFESSMDARSIYEIVPIILAFAVLVWSPMIWQVHVLFREAAKYHALREDAFTKGQIILFIATGNYDDKTRYDLIRRFITYHERQSSVHIILNTKPPSIPQKGGFDAINLKNWINRKSD